LINRDIKKEDNIFSTESRTIVVSVKDAEGDPQNMTGWGLAFRMLFEENVALEKTTVVLQDGEGTADQALITILKDDWPAGETNYDYYFERSDAGLENRLVGGKFYLG
jgi:hypothetical protein